MNHRSLKYVEQAVPSRHIKKHKNKYTYSINFYLNEKGLILPVEKIATDYKFQKEIHSTIYKYEIIVLFSNEVKCNRHYKTENSNLPYSVLANTGS